MALALVGVAAGLGLLGAVVVFVLMRGWTNAFRNAISGLARGGARQRVTQGEMPIGRDIESMIADLRLERRYSPGIHVEWSPKTLHQLLVEELPGAQVMVVSNREPYIHNRTDDGVMLQTPASGLVSALEPVMRACGGVWIAHGSGSADRDTVDRNDRVAVPPDEPAYSLRRVWLSEEEQDGYYYGFANEGLWPLCHIAFVRPIFRESDWTHYVAVNRRFADAVVQEASREDPIVLVQDYHFALLPRMIRERLPRATVITFWHIPWPNAETFSICPWREAIIDGLLGSSILGFHTRFHCNNFLEGVDRFMESRIDRERNSVTLAGNETLVRAYPISIEWPPAALARAAPVAECRRIVVEAVRAEARRPHRRRHRALRLHQGHRRPHVRGRDAARPSTRNGAASSCSCRPRRRPAASSNPTAPCNPRRSRPPRRSTPNSATATTSRSCCRSATTSRRKSIRCSAPPTSAWCRVCTTA